MGTNGAQTTASKVQLGVLDLCRRSVKRSSREALEDTLALAVLADQLGYSRFWIGEHHVENSASACPEILVGLVAARTHRIRVGSGGVLIRYYSPFKVAEEFLVLEALFAGRIDLGVAKGPGVTRTETARALVSDNEWELLDETFEHKVSDLTHYLRSAPQPAQSGGFSLAPRPWGVTPPPVWVLGSGLQSARLAARLGVPYSFSLFFGNGTEYSPSPVDEYRRTFLASPEHSSARASVAVSVLCLADRNEAQKRHARMVAKGCLPSNIVGTPEECSLQLRDLVSRFEADELLIMTWLINREERFATYEWLAQELWK